MTQDARWALVNETLASLNLDDDVNAMVDSIEKPNYTRLSGKSRIVASMIIAARKKGMQPKYYVGADQFSDTLDIYEVTFDDHLSFDENYEKAFKLRTTQVSMRVISLDAWEYILGIH